MRHGILLLLLIFHLFPAFSQLDPNAGEQIRVEYQSSLYPTATTQYLQYLPEDYSDTGIAKPILFFFHGKGETYNSSLTPIQNAERVKTNGPPKLVTSGEDFPFIIISPQWINTNPWVVNYMDEVIQHCLATYNVDESRIYITGLSLGATGTWEYVRDHGDIIAAAMPIAGWAGSAIASACNESIRNTPIWAFVGENDQTSKADSGYLPYPSTNNKIVNDINACTPGPFVPARKTIYDNTGHDAWTKTYNGIGGAVVTDNPTYNGNIPYGSASGSLKWDQWLMQYSLSNAPSNQSPVANSGGNVTITLPQTSVTLTGSGTDSDGNIASYQWSQAAGPSTATLSGQNTAALSASNLVEGSYTFSLLVTDNGGASDSDEAVVTVSAGSQVTTSWESYDVVMQAGSPQGTVAGSDSGPIANLEFYESTNNLGVDKGNLFTTYNAGSHGHSDSYAKQYWANASGNTYPYVGKSSVARGQETGEGNVPAPTGVFDMAIHPPNNDHLTVAAFIIPQNGDYKISNLAIRRVTNIHGPTTLLVFDSNKNLLSTVQATNNQDWVIDTEEYLIPGLAAGDRLYFAAYRDGNFYADFAEISWSVTQSSVAQFQVQNNIEEFEISAFPNPINNELQLLFKGLITEIVEVEFSNTFGEVVHKQTVNINDSQSAKIALNALKIGVYYLKVTTSKVQKTVRVVKE